MTAHHSLVIGDAPATVGRLNLLKRYEGVAVITKADYKRAVHVVSSRDESFRLKMLQAQYEAPGYEINASDMARQIGVHVNKVNSAYGKLGHDLANALGFVPPAPNRKNLPEWWRVLSLGRQEGPRFIWTMHSELAEALVESELVG